MPNNPSYTGGAVTFDSTPSTNLAIQLYQKKLAREQAFDDYERNRLDRINEKGVRDIDREGLDNRILELKGFYNANKDHIRKGNTSQAYDYEKKIRDVSSYINASKERTAKAEAANKLRQERLKSNRMMDDDFWDSYQTNEKAIDEEGSQTMDLTKWMSQSAPKYDPNAAIKMFADVKRKAGTPIYSEVEGDPFKKTETITETFDDDAKTTIAVRAQNLYDSNDGFAVHVQEQIKDPLQRGRLQKIFVDEFKTTPQSERDYAVASMIEQLQPSITKTKTIDDWKAKADYMQRYKERNIGLSRAARAEEINDVFKVIRDLAKQKKDEGKPYAQINLLPTDAQQVVIDQARKAAGDNYIDQSDLKIVYDDDNNVRLIDAKNNKLIGYLTQVGVNLGKQPGVQEKRAVVSEGGKVIQTRPTPSKKEIKRSDIRSKAAAAGYSEKEYENLLKKNGVKIID